MTIVSKMALSLSDVVSEFKCRQLNFDLFHDKFSNALDLIANLPTESFNQSISDISELLHNILSCILPNKNMFDQSIDANKLLIMTQDTIGQLTDFLNNIPHKYSVQMSTQLGGTILPYLIIFHCVPLFSELTDVIDFEKAIKNFFKCEQFSDCLNTSILMTIGDILKSRNANGNEEWTLVYGNTIVWKHLVFYVKNDNMHMLIYNLFPTTIQLIENFLVSNQLIGLECLRLFLNHQNLHAKNLNCFSVLKSNGYDQLIFIRLRHMLHKTDEETFDILMENLYSILQANLKTKVNTKFSLNSNNLKSALETDKKLEEVFIQLIDNITFNQSNETLIHKHLNLMQRYIFPLMKCNLIKFAKTFVLSICALFDKSLISAHYDLIGVSLFVLYDFISAIKVQISVHETKLILTNLSKILIKLNLDNVKYQEDIFNGIFKILLLIEQSSNESARKMLTQFCKLTLKSETISKEITICPQELISFFTRNTNSN